MGVRFGMIGIFVNDLKAMVAFYKDVLGIRIEWDGQGPYAEFGHEGIRFAMYARSELKGLLGVEPSYAQGINGTFELAIFLPRFEDVDPEFERVVAKGAKPIYAPRNEPWGMRSCMVTDPEGNLLEIGSWNTGATETV